MILVFTLNKMLFSSLIKIKLTKLTHNLSNNWLSKI